MLKGTEYRANPFNTPGIRYPLPHLYGPRLRRAQRLGVSRPSLLQQPHIHTLGALNMPVVPRLGSHKQYVEPASTDPIRALLQPCTEQML